MSQFEKRVQLNKIIESQLPEFLVVDFPKAVEFFKQYYISQEFQGGNTDLIDNLDRYIKLDNLIPEVVVGKTTLSSAIDADDDVITVASTKGFPDEYGLLKIGDEIITYTGKTETTFTGCIRGFSGITGYDDTTISNFSNVNRQSVIFEDTSADSHETSETVHNLSALFLQEFYKKLKRTFTPGLEEETFVEDLDVGNFIKHARSFYQSKGIEESVIILFKVLYGVEAKVLDLENRLIKPSSAEYIRREQVAVEVLSGNPFKLEGQTVYRSNDLETNAAVSEVEIFTRDNETFYNFGLFVGYNDRDLIEGKFDITPFTRSLEERSPTDTIITVDSTIGFAQTGHIVANNQVIYYSSKSVNQFFGCVGISTTVGIGTVIDKTSDIRSNETVFGYEDGDITKPVHFRITGVLKDFEAIDDIPLMEEDEIVSVKHVGEVINNPSQDKTYKETFANSWIYNTSTRFSIDEINGATFTLKTDIDKSQLKKGDTIEVLIGDSNNRATQNLGIVDSINNTTKEVVFSGLTNFTPNPNLTYSIRRILVKADTSGVELKDGRNKYLSNVLNVYTDDKSQFGYVASNSLPGYSIQDQIVESSIPDGTVNNLGGYDNFFKNYSTIKFPQNVKFIDGDQIRYTADNQLSGLVSGDYYYVKKVTNSEIKLYISLSLLQDDMTGNDFVRFGPNTNTTGVHNFTLTRHEDRVLSPNSILRKFPLSPPQSLPLDEKRGLGNIGMLIDGTEISSPESTDSVYYGPLESFDVLNGGRDYDVLNPPSISITTDQATGSGAKVEPIIVGSVKEVFVDPQPFDIDAVESVSIKGGNGSGAVLQPVVGARFREIEFDSRPLSLGGGVDIINEIIRFKEPHFLSNGDTIIYNQNGNEPIALGPAYDGNQTIEGELVSGDEYVVRVINTSSIKLFKTAGEALTGVAGINTLGLAVPAGTSGIHKFRTVSKKNLRQIKVLESGSGYTHRKLRVKNVGFSTEYNTISFKGHGFDNGDIVNYTYSTFSGVSTTTDLSVVGLSSDRQYHIHKLDDDKFKLIDVGIGGTVTENITKKKYVDIVGFTTDALNLQGGYQIFQYPPIEVEVNVSYANTTGGTFIITPLITGEITDAYLYETGSGYGSETLNLHTKPLVAISEGKGAQLNPIITNGRIQVIQILNKGSGYLSLPELVVEDTSATPGTGAILKPVIENGQLIDIVVLNGGLGYSSNSTTIYVKSRGFGAKFDTRVRRLNVNDAFRFAEASRNNPNVKIFSNLYKNRKIDNLVYGIFGYSQDLGSNFEELNGSHSPIIGWAYDGNPIYGPFGYSDPVDIQSGIRIINPSYEQNSNNISDRPTGLAAGFFIDDYRYTGSGDLDRHNGRYCRTPEFPNGVYAYFVGVTTSAVTGELEPLYPYVIGDTYNSQIVTDNFKLDQSFDFNNSNLVRNTLPYNVSKDGADYDFLNESYEKYQQLGVVDAVTQGVIDEIRVIDGGEGYQIDDTVNFDLSESGGSGLRGSVSELIGIGVTLISTTKESFEGVILEWDNDRQVSAYNLDKGLGFSFNEKDTVLVSGLSTSLAALNSTFQVGIKSETVGLAGTMASYTSTPGGTYEDIFLSRKFNTVSVGSTLVVSSEFGNEILTVLNNYNNGVLRVHRFGTAGYAHTIGSELRLQPNRITLPVRTKEFNSDRVDKVFFNALHSVGIGTTTGGATQKTFTIGNVTETVSIPFNQIYIPGHPFKTGEKVIFKRSNKPGVNSILAGEDNTPNNNFFIPNTTTLESELYVINKGPNYIGLVTTVGLTTSGYGLYFHTSGSDDAQYSLENVKTQVTADIDRLVTQVGCAATHGLINGDKVRMNVVPKGTVGIGTSTQIKVKFDENNKKLLLNPVGITSSDISTTTNQITIINHGYKTGDKVYYESSEVAAGLHTGSYYVIEDTRSKFRLAETLYDSNPDNETSVNIVGTGDTHHTFSLVNPRIEVIKNNSLKFDLSDESLDGYKFNIYTDSDFINEYISSYDSREFNVVGLGTVGIGTTGEASVTLNYSKNVPTKLFYNIEKSGYITTADNSVNNFSQIEFVDSPYNGSYNVFGIGSTTFKFSPVQLPENLTYFSEDCEKLEYSTKSSSAINGSIGKISLVSEGFNFNRLPKFEDVTSTDGVNANVVAISTSIGRIKKVRFRSIGYDYSGDKTLRPEAMVAPIVGIDNLDVINEIDIEYGGANYLSDPKVILWDDTNKVIVNDDMFEASAPFGAIAEIKQLGPIFGLKSEPHKLIAVNNSNGVGISSMITSQAGIATCTLTTPILGFTTSLFTPGDNIFVEGVQMETSGDGYNSEDYEYKFFKVIDYINSSPAILTFSLESNDGIGFTTSPGFAKIFQSGYATIVNKKNYPIINIVQDRSPFTINEGLSVDVGTGYFPSDLTVSMVRDDYIKVSGNYVLKAGSKIRGVVSGTVADVTDVTRKRAKLNIDYASRVNTGWRDDIGKVSEDYQVTSDNDYHQNLSYSVQSPITWDEFSSPVNSVIHPAGMKNFADVGITSSAPAVGIGTTLQSVAIVVLDIINERRVDIINNFDNAVDVEPINSQFGTFLQSNQLQIENTKLASFTECRTNRVLIHDDISDKFSSRGFQDLFSEIEVISDSENHVRYLIQIVDPDTDAVQLSELIYQSNGDGTNAFLFEKYSSFSDRKLGNFSTNIDSKGRKTLIFTPTDPYDTDHDIKILKRTFQFESLPAGNSGFGTESFGSVNLTGSFVTGITSVGSVGIQTSIKTIATFDATDFNAAFASIEIIDALNREDANYIEAVLDFDGSNTYLSEYYFDTTTQSYSAVQTGVLDVDYDSSANVISLKAKNTGISTTVSYDVRSNIVGFGTTASGIGTYRFLVNRQPAGTEISARLESTNNVGTSTIRVAQFDIESVSSSASIVRVAAGQSSAVHQVAILANDEDNFTTVIPGPFAPVNNTTGLGTFSGEVSGTNFYLNFHPDAGYQDVETQALNEVFYREMDFDNQSRPLEYGPIDQNLLLTAYDGLNGLRANRTSFNLTHEGKPIYVKKFDPNVISGNPAVDTIVNYATGVIQMKDHFLNTGEELIYTPVSTFTGIGASAMGIGQTANYLGIVTDRLPERVYPIALTPNTFQLATKEEYARAGIFVTFTDAGLGNAHELEFTKKLTKTVIGLDGIVQQPINFTPIAHTLIHNSGSIGVGINTFNLSGIASVQARDLIRIDDEYMKVIEVGFSTNAGGQILGPINGVIAAGAAATFSTVSVERGSVGSAATSHTDGAEARVYRGSINIVKNKVHFIDPPKGNSRARRNESNLPYVTAEFSGRTFLRQNYATNMIFDDISDSFTGIAKTYTNKVSGLNTVGIDPGNGILFINGVFQTPTTENNVGQNYIFENDTTNGISSVVFTGITSTDGTKIESEFDINQNQIPRGGLVVSLGSTPGLGYAPLVGAQVIAKKNNSGELTEIVGINTYLNPVAISTADYDRNSGIMEIETSSPHYLKGGDSVRLIGLGFTCTLGSSTYTYPDHNRPLEIFNIIDRTKLNVVVGPSTVDHFYVGGGTVNEHFKCNTGSGYRNPIAIGVTDIEYEHRFSRALANGITDDTSATHTVTDASYIPHTGVLQLTIDDHGLTTSNTITITDNSIFFRCEDDSFFTEQPYPRSTDPVSGVSTTITAVTSDTITVNVGRGGGGGNGAVVSAQVGAGGTLAFSIDNPGTGYINPQIIVPQPNYENMSVVGVSRLGIGTTTDCGKNLLVNLEIAQTTENKTGDRFFDASNLIEANVDFIADIAYGRMLAQFPSYTPPAGTTGRDCKDDIVDVLEAMAYNLKFGGNDLTVDAANLYITGAHVQGEEDQTIYAFGQAKEMAVQAMRNETITTGGYTALTQFKDVTITTDSNTPYCANVASAIHTLVGIVTMAVDPNIGTVPTRTIAPGALYNVSNFKIARNGYGFAPGDVVKVVGLVTAKGFTEPVEDFKIEITQTFNDFFSAWSFGEMDYIDSIAAYQDGIRTRFPIYYENNLLSFELDPASDLSSAINLDAVLVIFINGVLQTPGYSYSFDGGTSFIFSRPPKINDRVDIFFYVGTQGVDVGITTVKESLKVGDDLFVRKHPDFASTVDHLTNRTIRELVGSDTLETPTYIGPGIDSNTFRPFDWIKQKNDKFVNGDIIPKTRPILEPLIFPTAKVIGNIEIDSTEIFVDNAQFFDFDEIAYGYKQNTFTFDAFIVDGEEDPQAAEFSVSVSAGGTVNGITIVNPGLGYTGSSLPIAIAAPKHIGVGIGTTALATATVSTGGTVTSVTITDPGFGYTSTNPPNSIIEVPSATTDSIFNSLNVQGFAGIITGIAPATGSNGETAIKFMYNGFRDYLREGEKDNASNVQALVAGYPVYIFDTVVGNGVTSIYSSDNDVVGIGTSHLDNIYIVDSATSAGTAPGEIICNVHSGSNLAGIAATGNWDDNNAGLTTALGYISWGRIYNFDARVNPLAIGVTGYTVNSGLTTFPTMQRRGSFGEFNTGAVLANKPRASNSSNDLYVDNNLIFYP